MYGFRRDLIFVDDETGTTLKRQGLIRLQEQVLPGDTIGVVWQDRFSRNFEDGVAIQKDLTEMGIWIFSIKENIDTKDGSAGAKFFRRMLLAQGAYQADSTSERIRAGIDRARADGKRLGRLQASVPLGIWPEDRGQISAGFPYHSDEQDSFNRHSLLTGVVLEGGVAVAVDGQG